MNQPGVVLSYSTPRYLFERPYRYRSWNAVIFAVFLFLAASP